MDKAVWYVETAACLRWQRTGQQAGRGNYVMELSLPGGRRTCRLWAACSSSTAHILLELTFTS